MACFDAIFQLVIAGYARILNWEGNRFQTIENVKYISELAAVSFVVPAFIFFYDIIHIDEGCGVSIARGFNANGF